MIDSFKIHEIGYNPSDHFPLVVTCRFTCRTEDYMNKAAGDLLSEGYSLSVKREKKINSDDVNWDNYKHIAKNEIDLLSSSVSDLAATPSQSLLDRCLKKITTALYNTAKSCSNNSQSVAGIR